MTEDTRTLIVQLLGMAGSVAILAGIWIGGEWLQALVTAAICLVCIQYAVWLGKG